MCPIEQTEPISTSNTISNTSISTGDNSPVNVIQAAAGATVIIGAQAGAGLNALNDLVQLSPELRAAVGTFSADFRAATNQVDVLGDYKDLHDLLHQLQFQVYGPMLREAPRFPDELTLEVLDDYQRTMRDQVAQLISVSSRNRVAETDLTFIPEISQAQIDLKSALDDINPDSLKKTIWRIKRVLTKHPAIIDTRLNSAARSLRLSSIVAALFAIQGDLDKLKLDPDKVSQFQLGRNMIESMCQRLDRLVIDHEQWQNLDMELRRIEALIEQDLMELEMSWDDLKNQANPLFQSCTDQWAASLQEYANQLDQYLAANNPLKIRQAFRNFRHEAGSRFFQVDIDLKNLCGELRQIGEPLAIIVRSLE